MKHGLNRYRIFICNDPARFICFANLNYRVGGVHYFFNHNTFLRPSLIARDRLIGPSGHQVPGARTLTYFITHEVTHGVTAYATATHYGALSYLRLPVWIREGYADYVALYQGQGAFGNSALSGRKSAFDFQANLIKYRQAVKEPGPKGQNAKGQAAKGQNAKGQNAKGQNAPELDPQKSGLYLRYHLLVAFWLDIKRRSVAALFKEKPPQANVEAEIQSLK